MKEPQAPLPDEAINEATEWMNRINSDENIPGEIIGLSGSAHAVVYVSTDLYDSIRSGLLSRDQYPTEVGGYSVFYTTISDRPIPFATTEQTYALQEKLMPLKDGVPGVVSVGCVNVPGGYRVVVRITPKCNREAVQSIINEYAVLRDVVIVTGDEAYRH